MKILGLTQKGLKNLAKLKSKSSRMKYIRLTDKPRTTHDYVKWVLEDEYPYSSQSDNFLFDKIQSFNSRSLKEVFIRGEEPILIDYFKIEVDAVIMEAKFNKDHKSWQNFKLPFLGEWEEIIHNDSKKKISLVFDFKGERIKYYFHNQKWYFQGVHFEVETMDDFIRACDKKGIELMINPEFEI